MWQANGAGREWRRRVWQGLAGQVPPCSAHAQAEEDVGELAELACRVCVPLLLPPRSSLLLRCPLGTEALLLLKYLPELQAKKGLVG